MLQWWNQRKLWEYMQPTEWYKDAATNWQFLQEQNNLRHEWMTSYSCLKLGFLCRNCQFVAAYYSENCRIFHLRVSQLQVEPYLSSRCKHIFSIIVNPSVQSSVFAAASCCLRRHQLSCLSFNVAQDTLTFRLIKECGLVHPNIRSQMHPRCVFQVFTPVLGDLIVSLREDINTSSEQVIWSQVGCSMYRCKCIQRD